MVGKDMTYFTEGVMGLLQEYHPLPSAANYHSFEEQHLAMEKFIQ